MHVTYGMYKNMKEIYILIFDYLPNCWRKVNSGNHRFIGNEGISKERKKRKVIFSTIALSLASYLDLARCFYNDFWRSIVFLDYADDAHLST